MAGKGKQPAGFVIILQYLTVFYSPALFCVIISIYSLDNFAEMGLESGVGSQGGVQITEVAGGSFFRLTAAFVGW